MHHRPAALALLFAALSGAALPAAAEDRFVLIQSTTSTEASGLYDAILPKFEAATGIEARVVAVGTGQAIRNAERCDGDVLLVHAREAEERFVAAGHGLWRRDVMENQFAIVGPAEDPAGIRGMAPAQALARLAEAQALVISRGDDSGTHRRETALWQAAGIDPRPASGDWYREAGAGMGATLNMAAAAGGHTLTDSGTWLAFGNRQGLEVLVDGGPGLENPYGVIPVSPEACPNARVDAAVAFADWLVSAEGQAAIGAVTIDGQRLFTPNAAPAD